MNYWRSDAKNADGESLLAAFNVREDDDGFWIGAVVVNEHTKAGDYRLSNEQRTITLVLPPEWATQGAYRCVVDEAWETT